VPVFGGKNIIHQGRPFFIIPMFRVQGSWFRYHNLGLHISVSGFTCQVSGRDENKKIE
jgi:hypothetical protein